MTKPTARTDTDDETTDNAAELAAAELAAAEAWLDELDPETTPAEDPVDLRRIGHAARAIDAAREELGVAVAAARENGRSWGAIGMVLGVSKQAARERFSDVVPTQRITTRSADTEQEA